jgi:hypothetical protein
MGIFSKKKPDLQEILRKQYMDEMNTMVVYTNGVRINEKLTGRLKEFREIIPAESKSIIPVQSSTSRPVDFKNDIAAWLEAVRMEARKLVRGDLSPLRKVA